MWWNQTTYVFNLLAGLGIEPRLKRDCMLQRVSVIPQRHVLPLHHPTIFRWKEIIDETSHNGHYIPWKSLHVIFNIHAANCILRKEQLTVNALRASIYH